MEEELLIEHVRSNPVLYDPTHRDYRNQNARKAGWDEIGEKHGVSGNECKESWNKLRNAYNQALKRRSTKYGQESKNLGKWKFEDEMAFLLPTLEPRKQSDDGLEDEPARPQDEEADLQPFLSPQVQMGDLSQAASQVNQSGNIRLSGNAIAKATGVSTLESVTCPSIRHQFSKPNKRAAVGKRRLESSVQQMVAIMKDNNRLRSEYVMRDSAPHDDCDLFFLSLARTVKKLRRDVQFKTKMEISEIVFRAELDNYLPHTGGSTPQHFQYLSTSPAHQYSAASSPHQSVRSYEGSSSSQSPHAAHAQTID